MATIEDVIKIMGVMAHAFPRYELSADSIKMYARYFQDIPKDILEAAANQIVAESTFFPSVAEWRNMALRLMQDPSALTAAEAWEEVISEIKRVGQYRKPEFSNPLIQKAVNCFGWITLCMSESIEYDRSQFFKVYDTFVNRERDNFKLLPDVRRVSERYQLGVGDLVKKLSMPKENND